MGLLNDICEKIECNNCNYENRQDAKFCTQCGTVIVNSNTGMVSDGFPAGASTISIKDSIITGGSNRENADDMEEDTKAIELWMQMKKDKLKLDADVRIKEIEKDIRFKELEEEKGDDKRNGELMALDIAKSLNELRSQCTNDEEVFSISMTLVLLLKKVKDEESIEYIEDMSKRLKMYDNFDKLNDETKKQIIVLCKYIEESYCSKLIHGDTK